MQCLKVDGGIVTNSAIFDVCPENWVESPAGVGIGWTDNGDGTFSPPVIVLSPADHADARVAALVADCHAHIVAGQVSDALGTPHTYPTENTTERPDQHNLNGLVTASMVMAGDPSWTCLFWCADEQGNWARRVHTHEQIQQVGLAVAQRVINAQDQITNLKAQLYAIRDDGVMTDEEKRAAMDLVVWPV